MDMETIKLIKELIGSYGFPIFIACWLLWERKNIGNKLINRMDHLIDLLESRIIEKIAPKKKFPPEDC